MRFNIVSQFCDLCHAEIKADQPAITPIGGKTHCERCWRRVNSTSPSEYGKLGMKELLIKSILPTYEEIDLESFSFTVDNHLDYGGVPTRAQTVDMRFRLKSGKFVDIHIE